MDLFLYLIAGFACCLSAVDCIMFHLHPNTQKCLREELQKNILFVGEFEVTPLGGVDYVVSILY